MLSNTTIAIILSTPWLSIVKWGGALIYAILLTMAITTVLRQNRNPVKSLAWITVVTLLPVVGLLLFMFVGQSIRNTKMLSRRRRRRLRNSEPKPNNPLPPNLPQKTRQLVKVVNQLHNGHYFQHNSITIYHNGQAKFDSLFQDLRTAKHYINLEYYIIADDRLGNQLARILIDRAAHGVKVHLIYDYIGSLSTDRKYFATLTAAGIEVKSFFRINLPSKATRINWRNHRKVVVIDGHTGYIGGLNVADRYIDGGKSFDSWRDTAVRVCGDAVAGLQYNFAVDWAFIGGTLITDKINSKPQPTAKIKSGAQILSSGPTGRMSNVAMTFLRAITGAQKRIWLQTPYFIPSDGMLRALQIAAMSGADVRIMLPKRSDSAILDCATASYIDECLRSGIKIYLYTAGMLHCKVLIIDDEISTIGSANFDFRSFEHNFEENIILYGTEPNTELSQQFLTDMSHCTKLQLNSWHHRPKLAKVKESLSRLLSPLL